MYVGRCKSKNNVYVECPPSPLFSKFRQFFKQNKNSLFHPLFDRTTFNFVYHFYVDFFFCYHHRDLHSFENVATRSNKKKLFGASAQIQTSVYKHEAPKNDRNVELRNSVRKQFFHRSQKKSSELMSCLLR